MTSAELHLVVTPSLPDSQFLQALGTRGVQAVPPQTSLLTLRAKKDWERSNCENKAVAILNQMQAGKKALIKKDAGEMLLAIVLDKPLAEAQALVQDSDAFMRAITQIMQSKQSHPVIARMLNPDVRDDLPPSAHATGSSDMTRHPNNHRRNFKNVFAMNSTLPPNDCMIVSDHTVRYSCSGSRHLHGVPMFGSHAQTC